MELVRLSDLLDARAQDVLSLEVAHPLVDDRDVAVPEIVGVQGEREPNHEDDEDNPESCICILVGAFELQFIKFHMISGMFETRIALLTVY